MTSPVSLLDLAAASLASAIVAADQIVTLAKHFHNNSNNYKEDTDNKEDKKDDTFSKTTTSTTTTSAATSDGMNNDNNDNNDVNNNVRLKNDGSFVTNADLASQQIIVDALNNISTDIRIVGEESEEEMKLYAITGHELRSQQMYQLCRQEIQMRFTSHQQHPHQYPLDQHQQSLPLAQIHHHGTKNGKRHLDVGVLSHQVNWNSIRGSTMTDSSAKEQQQQQEYQVDPHRVSVFIDPLDGTKAYAKGDYQPVSILIAIILDRTPCFGVICKPFGYPGQTSVLDTNCVVIYGGTLVGGAYTAGGSSCHLHQPSSLSPSSSYPSSYPWSTTFPTTHTSNGNPFHDHALDSSSPTITTTSSISSSSCNTPPSTQHLPRAVISSGRSKGIVQDFVTHLGNKGMIDPTPLLVTGAGEKSLRIILRSQNEGLWFFPKPGTSLWDVAASDALLRATGGRLTDKNGNDLDYTKSRTDAENHNGIVACFDQQLHAECIRLFLEQSWQE
jgi:3'-phosphoadenosine 5'-phosphosulfate (PAPS) 3'-phosphatase